MKGISHETADEIGAVGIVRITDANRGAIYGFAIQNPGDAAIGDFLQERVQQPAPVTDAVGQHVARVG